MAEFLDLSVEGRLQIYGNIKDSRLLPTEPRHPLLVSRHRERRTAILQTNKEIFNEPVDMLSNDIEYTII